MIIKMKFYVLLIVMLPLMSKGQTILNVGANLPTANTNFTNLQDAIDYADPNDIIYIYPGNYSSVSLTKSLRLIGVGYLNHENYPTIPNSIIAASFVDQIDFIHSGHNSIVQGIYVKSLILDEVSNLIFEGCRIGRGQFDDATNILFQGCYMQGSFYDVGFNDYQYLLSRNIIVEFKNCLFESSFQNGTLIAAGSNGSTSYSGFTYPVGILTIDRSIFDGRIAAPSGLQLIMKNSIGRTHIGIPTNSASHSVHNSIFLPTSIYGVDCSTTSSNLCGIDSDSLFVGFPSNSGYSFDTKYQLDTNSPAINFADDGGDCGIYDGNNPYVPSGIPPVPFIYDFDADHQGTTGGGIDVNIKVKSQD